MFKHFFNLKFIHYFCDDGGMPDEENWDPDGVPEGCEVPIDDE